MHITKNLNIITLIKTLSRNFLTNNKKYLFELYLHVKSYINLENTVKIAFWDGM